MTFPSASANVSMLTHLIKIVNMVNITYSVIHVKVVIMSMVA